MPSSSSTTTAMLKKIETKSWQWIRCLMGCPIDSPFWRVAQQVATSSVSIAVLAMCILDTILKIAVYNMTPYKRMHLLTIPLPFVDNIVFHLDYMENKGHIFGSTLPQYGPLSGFRATIHMFATLTMLFTLSRCAHEARTVSGQYYSVRSIMLLIYGSLGNFWDRAYLGFVVDFISIAFPGGKFCFNLTDIIIALLLFSAILSTYAECCTSDYLPEVIARIRLSERKKDDDFEVPPITEENLAIHLAKLEEDEEIEIVQESSTRVSDDMTINY